MSSHLPLLHPGSMLECSPDVRQHLQIMKHILAIETPHLHPGGFA